MSFPVPVIKTPWRALLLAAFVALALVGSSARADNIDEQLLKQAPALFDYLHQQGYKNVGVLKFQVQKGTQKPSYNVGDMNLNMARRLENALVLFSGPQQPLGVIHDAGQTAADRHAHLSLQDEADRRQLFEFSYSLAGDRTKVSADCFLTGMVKVTPDMRKTSVTVQAFGRSAPALAEVLSFSVPTDRSILADLGQSFLVSKRSLTKRDLADDKEADRDAQDRDDSKKPDLATSPDRWIDFKVLYDDQEFMAAPDPTSAGEWRIQEPRAGQKVVFVIKNISSEQLAVALMVNGINTLYEQQEEADKCDKWVLEPGEEYTIDGFYLNDSGQSNVVPFKVLEDEESKAAEVNLKAPGTFELTAFVSSPSGDSDMKVSLRGLSQHQLKKSPPKSLDDLRAKLMKAAKLALNHKGLIVADTQTPAASGDVVKVPFPTPKAVEHRKIRYYDPQAAR